GLIALLMASRAPELFNKVVCLDPVGAKGVKFDNSMISAFEAMKTDRALTATVIGSTIKDNKPDSDFFQQVVVEDAFRAVKSVGHLVLKALDGLDVTQELSSVQHPVLVLHGEHDVLLPMQDSKSLAGLVKNGRFEVLSGRGHCANVEDPKTFVATLQRFLFA
ncbi:MAG: alpha/beta hydrolase, partial [Bdellovibrionaceae bacterium]|nr:alpha/beta hydrolase [Pseudobdellovibrionaceae bacterium]